jgi:hypothetical protein
LLTRFSRGSTYRAMAGASGFAEIGLGALVSIGFVSCHGGGSGRETKLAPNEASSACGLECGSVGAEVGAISVPAAGLTDTAGAPVFPLVVSQNRRFLQDQRGVPFPILGDSGWLVARNLHEAGWIEYLNDRVSRGFNSILQLAIDHRATVDNHQKPPADIEGNLPFRKRLDGKDYNGSPNGTTRVAGRPGKSQHPPDPYTNVAAESPDFTSPNESYFKRLDAFVQLCAGRGILIFMWPAYVGWGADDDGWMVEMVANDAAAGAGALKGGPFADPSKSKLWNYGAWLAHRYKLATNIIWVHGGDYGDQANNGGVFTNAEKHAVESLFAGMKSVPEQKSGLHTAHWSRGSLATDVDLTAGSFDLEAVYADRAAAQWSRRGYAHQPSAPTFMVEGYYDGNPKAGRPLRRFQWWAMLSGIAGQFYGHEEVWPFDGGWESFLGAPSTKDTVRLNAFMRSIAWQDLVPSGLDGTKQLVVAGGGVADPQSEDYVAAAAAHTGKLLVAYIPSAHKGPISVDMSVMNAGPKARWYNPSSAKFGDISEILTNTGTHRFEPPATNGSSDNDWVLVVTAH